MNCGVLPEFITHGELNCTDETFGFLLLRDVRAIQRWVIFNYFTLFFSVNFESLILFIYSCFIERLIVFYFRLLLTE